MDEQGGKMSIVTCNSCGEPIEASAEICPRCGVANPTEPLKLELDLNVLNHLGINLYSNTPAVLTEIVANAWDADASRVDIEINSSTITITDNGIGMNYSDLRGKFLTVGYPRRDNGEISTPSGRQCMGRKGIGKLAMFSLAKSIVVITRKADGGPYGLIFSVEDLKEKIKNKKDYIPQRIDDFSPYSLPETGTVIKLIELQQRVNKTESFLRKRIARRFSVIGAANDFQVYVNGQGIGLSDRAFYQDVQFLWTFGDRQKAASTLAACRNVTPKYHHHFDGVTSDGMTVDGFIGSVVKPEQLRKEGDNNNTITLLANGRLFEEDLQKRIDDSKVFNSYLVGELEVNGLDLNDRPDIAVSSRQGVQEDDPRYQDFLAYIKSRLGEIANFWDAWRREVGGAQMVTEFPKLKDWIESLPPRHRPKAQQLINKINTIRFSGTEEYQRVQRREVVKAQVLAFEKLRLQDNLDAIANIDVEKNVAEFREIMITVEDLEASLHRDIISQRLAVIKKLDEDQQNRVKEVVVQEHIYNHLWLVDSKWEYKENPTDWELRLTAHLKTACPDTTEGARLDIGYRTTAGRYIVIELKKPGLPVTASALLDQGEKYVMALSEYFDKNPGSSPIAGQAPSIDVVFIVDKCPKLHEIHQGRLRNINGRITTYKDLVVQANSAYEDYLQASKKVGRIREIIENI
ncbi:ATP-binding protein [Pseudomonas paraeruginosa]|uniref:BbrUII/HgiDII family restriction enzyme n=1 Tax=Pseudomonas paraeruginosa TaxID=2994495 RepID=UPI003D2E35E1|nr:ATP-binding protein [Pseudomonas aeruginosa]MCO2311026.1 ATP-binding protein [Pseudomonas aeruginosa]